MRLDERRTVGGVNAVNPAPAKLVGELAPGEVEPRLVEEDRAALAIGHPDQDGRRVGEASKAAFALLERMLGAHLIRDVLGVSEDAWGHAGLVVEHIAVRPHPLHAILGHEAQEPAVHAVRPDALEIGIELALHRGRQEAAETPAYPVLRAKSQGLRGGGVDEEQVAVEIVHAHEAEAVFDETVEQVPALARRAEGAVAPLELGDTPPQSLDLLDRLVG